MRARVLAVAATMLVTACSHDTTADPATTAQLRHDMRALASAAAAHRYVAAESALSILIADASAARAAGKISHDQLAGIRTAAARIQTDLARATRRPVPTRTLTVSPSPSEHGKDHGDHGRGGGGD